MAPLPLRKNSAPGIALWLVLCALLNAAGWLLSAAAGQLNRTGYVLIFLATAGLMGWWWRSLDVRPDGRRQLRRLRRRFRRKLPLAFGILAGLAVLGGALHAPSNFDALAYRTPRVLHWLAENHWHWIHTDFNRLNTRTSGIEWISAPLLLFLKTDRGLFLINAVSFLLLPGRIFSIFTRLGIRPRVAWHWMWLLPTGYGYLLQAGSVGNDLFGAVFTLSAIDFALRARQSRQPADVCLAILAAALMTSAKVSNLPLLLPWAILMLPALKTLWIAPWRIACAGLLALLASMVPTAILNQVQCGDWKGLAAEPVHFCSDAKLLHLVVNPVQILVENFAPPLFPMAQKWNQISEGWVPAGLRPLLQAHFECGARVLQVSEVPSEERAGLGLGICALLIVAIIGGWRGRRNPADEKITDSRRNLRWLVCGGAWLSLAPFLMQAGISSTARYLVPVYPFLLLPLLATRAQVRVMRTVLWRRFSTVVLWVAAVLVIVSPARPLWPAISILRAGGAGESAHLFVRRLWKVYSVYAERPDAFAPVRADLPADLTVIGFVSFDNPETSLWRPFFGRRIAHIRPRDSREAVQARGINTILLSTVSFAQLSDRGLDAWLKEMNAEVVKGYQLSIRASRPDERWLLVWLRP